MCALDCRPRSNDPLLTKTINWGHRHRYITPTTRLPATSLSVHLRYMGARRHGQDGALAPPPENVYKARFASFTTFWFAQTEPKSLPRDTFHRLRPALGELTAFKPRLGSLQRSHSDKTPSCVKGIRFTTEKKGGVDRTGGMGKVRRRRMER